MTTPILGAALLAMLCVTNVAIRRVLMFDHLGNAGDRELPESIAAEARERTRRGTGPTDSCGAVHQHITAVVDGKANQPLGCGRAAGHSGYHVASYGNSPTIEVWP